MDKWNEKNEEKVKAYKAEWHKKNYRKVNRYAKGSVRSNAIKHGYRSGTEQQICEALLDLGVKFGYEDMVLKYTKPETHHKYTPDLTFKKLDGELMIVELKGRFTLEDRKKHLWIKDQYPDLDLRFCFCNSRQKLVKGGKVTYGEWAERNGFKYCDKIIPDSWLGEVERV